MAELEEIKGANFEEIEIPKDEGLIARTISKLQDRLREIRQESKEAEWLKTEEGKRWQAQQKERQEGIEKDIKKQAEAYAQILLEAKRQLVLDMEADKLIGKNKIADNDPRLSPYLYKLQEMSAVISNAYLRE